MGIPPVIYLGPSMRPEEARALLPGAFLRPPIRRGDLYRDRMLRFSLFIILDGLFFQSEAVSPREVVDVARDGALILGASSMGAMRAAECWPAGVRGVGLIYRLFRAGRLLSDDEVAVVVDPDEPERALSVALVTMRYALAKAVRAGLLSRARAEHATSTAAALHYPERTWPRLLRLCGLGDEDGQLRHFLERHDLKRDDAARALRRAATLLAREPALARRPRNSPAPFVLSATRRERPHDALAGEDPLTVQRQVCRLQFASGRYTRHLAALLDAPWLERRAGAESSTEPRAHLLSRLWERLPHQESEAAATLWEALRSRGETDTAIFRWRALQRAVAEAHTRRWTTTSLHLYLAERELAHAHGFPHWGALQHALEPHPSFLSWVRTCRDELALARRVKQALFQTPLAWRSLALGG
jgi:hypothetical protein